MPKSIKSIIKEEIQRGLREDDDEYTVSRKPHIWKHKTGGHKYIDMEGQPCDKQRCSGEYEETGFHDDMDGVLHCTNCGKETDRHRPLKKGTPRLRDLEGN